VIRDTCIIFVHGIIRNAGIWEWEAEREEKLRLLRKILPMPADEMLEFLERIRSYLNRMCHAGIEPLEF